jgi:hypothetical protein
LSCGNEDVKRAVQHVVDLISKAESFGNAVFTMAALSFFHDHPRKYVPKMFLSQTTIYACLSAVRLKMADSLRPEPAKMRTDSTDPTIIVSVAFVLSAQENLVSIKDKVNEEDPKDNIWP